MKYRVNAAWPAQGGAMMIASGTVIDDATHPNLVGAVPPPDVTPLDQATRDWLVKAYWQHSFTIPPVEEGKR